MKRNIIVRIKRRICTRILRFLANGIDIDSLDCLVDEMEGTLDTVGGEVDDLRGTIDEARDIADDAKNDTEDHERRIDELESSDDGEYLTQDDIDGLVSEGDVEHLDNKYDALITNLTERLVALEG